MRRLLVFVGLLGSVLPGFSQEKLDIAAALKKPILAPGQAEAEVTKFIEVRVPRLPEIKEKEAWQAYAAKVRAEVLDNVVYRGEAAAWRDAKTKVEWFDAEPGGTGYKIKKLRFEVLPDMWVPALLYEPEKMKGGVPATLNVMGHERGGKDVAYQQIRCINLARRGMLALNVEWFRFGQLGDANYNHGRMNQLDLCGTSGLAPFYLALKRGLDVLLSHPNADPDRVAVSGLSGGGWQTIWISALDTRVTLTNPVAGYSSFLTRIKHHKDLGDSEQTPCDMAKYADYTHFTAMLAPRASLLTYNAKDDCCFESGYALPPLLEAAGPFFRLHGKGQRLRGHVNEVPGTHNFEKDNREAFYRMIGDFFYPGDKSYSAVEIACADEVKQAAALRVKMPEKNADFNSLALEIAKKLPREGLPRTADGKRQALREVVRYHELPVEAKRLQREQVGETSINYWQLKLGKEWTIPVVEFNQKEPRKTSLVIHEAGRAAASETVKKLLAAGDRVVLVDPYYLGECSVGGGRGYLFALLVGSVGERPLGLQASQIAAAARWSQEYDKRPVHLVAEGSEFSGLLALVAKALEPKAIGDVQVQKSFGSLREVIERNMSYEQRPELFCFGLLEKFDIAQLRELAK